MRITDFVHLWQLFTFAVSLSSAMGSLRTCILFMDWASSLRDLQGVLEIMSIFYSCAIHALFS